MWTCSNTFPVAAVQMDCLLHVVYAQAHTSTGVDRQVASAHSNMASCQHLPYLFDDTANTPGHQVDVMLHHIIKHIYEVINVSHQLHFIGIIYKYKTKQRLICQGPGNYD